MPVIREWDGNEVPRFSKKNYSKAGLEIGSGNGLFLSEISAIKKDMFFFGIERLAECIKKTGRKIEKKGLTNVTLINGDIFTALEKYFERDFFDDIYINFPDPWFKRRHKRKRVVQDRMLKIYYRYLKDDGNIFFVTDNEEYRDDGIKSFLDNDFMPVFTFPYFRDAIENYPVSLYEEKWKKDDRPIFYSIFKKIIPKMTDNVIK
jgi:tRNA (guanine-N7-)-methyltransferase